MEWQEAPEIAHDEVKLGGDLEIFYPDWSHGIEIPNNADIPTIIETLKNENKK
jgi:DNA polymerase-1